MGFPLGCYPTLTLEGWVGIKTLGYPTQGFGWVGNTQGIKVFRVKRARLRAKYHTHTPTVKPAVRGWVAGRKVHVRRVRADWVW